MIVDRIRRWARGHTRRRRYSPVGVAFHWGVAGLILFQLWWGWRTGRLGVGAEKLAAYELHAHLGLLIFVLTLARMVWRLMIPGPVNDADKPGWQSTAAHATHFAFYTALLILPVSGWAMMSATAPDQALSVAAVVPWPQLPFHSLAPAQRWAIETWAERVHGWTVVALLVLIPMHVGATIKHELVDRDDVLMGMLPGLSTLRRLARRARRAASDSIAPSPPPRRPSGGG